MKWFYRIFLGVFVLVVVLVAADATVLVALPNHPPEIQKSDAVLVLGAAIHTPSLYYRTVKGLEIYEDGLADVMVFSGGKVSDADISEAEYMEGVILGLADQNANYILEDQARDTYENIKNTKSLLVERLGENEFEKDSSLIIVSDKFHLARAVLLAKRAGFEQVYWAHPEPVYYSERQLRFYYLREFVAILGYIPKLIFG